MHTGCCAGPSSGACCGAAPYSPSKAPRGTALRAMPCQQPPTDSWPQTMAWGRPARKDSDALMFVPEPKAASALAAYRGMALPAAQ